MIQTTFRRLHEAGACVARYRFLAKALGGIDTYGRDTPITLLQILDINGLDDALWALRACDNVEKFSRLLACDYAEHVLPIYEAVCPDDNRLRETIKVSRRYARGEATDAELSDAYIDAEASVRAVDGDATYAAYAARYAAEDITAAAAAWCAAVYGAEASVWDAERKWQSERLREILEVL